MGYHVKVVSSAPPEKLVRREASPCRPTGAGFWLDETVTMAVKGHNTHRMTDIILQDRPDRTPG